jgi:hypothetical protein
VEGGMNYLLSLEFQKLALWIAVTIFGSFLLVEAIKQLLTGQTIGREGKRQGGSSVVKRSGQPGYFWFLFCVRLFLGTLSLLCMILFKWW